MLQQLGKELFKIRTRGVKWFKSNPGHPSTDPDRIKH